jgi:hypothetical protein
MSAIVQALDDYIHELKFGSVKFGENGHAEFSWSSDIEEKIAQFDFQCVRSDLSGVSELASILGGILKELSLRNTPESKRLLLTLYKMIGKTRDIHGGKGEYTLSYMMIWVWYKYYPDLAKAAIQFFALDPNEVDERNTSQKPYGSWKDVKYLCDYIWSQIEMNVSGDVSGDVSGFEKHPLIQFCIQEINKRLRIDANTIDNNLDKNLSLVSKWIQRESSKKFKFEIYEALATNYFPEYMKTAKTESSRERAIKKCKTQYRMLCSKLNKRLDTVQIKQTSRQWSAIDHSKTTSITMAKQRKAFLNLKGVGGNVEPRSEDPDRVACAENLRAYLNLMKKEGKEVKGSHVGFEMFTKQALQLIYHKNLEEANILNSQWRDNGNQKNSEGLGPIIAMVDTSGSMYGDPISAAIALGCRVAEKSLLGKRVMTFSGEPCWIDLRECETFTDMVRTIYTCLDSAGTSTDFYKALDLILSAIETARISPFDVENMVLAIFSDMQIDDNLSGMNGTNYDPNEKERKEARGKWDTMFQQIKQKYADVGIRLYGVPLNPPHILFWNLRKTDGFPTLSTEAGCSMMSGYDSTILNMFCDLGMDALKELTPYNVLMKQLDNPRYDPLGRVFAKEILHN